MAMSSHEIAALIELTHKHNIILFLPPTHTTHKLQPLDVGVFGPFARVWLDRCDGICWWVWRLRCHERTLSGIYGYIELWHSSPKQLCLHLKSAHSALNSGVFNEWRFCTKHHNINSCYSCSPFISIPDVPGTLESDFDDNELLPSMLSCQR